MQKSQCSYKVTLRKFKNLYERKQKRKILVHIKCNTAKPQLLNTAMISV